MSYRTPLFCLLFAIIQVFFLRISLAEEVKVPEFRGETIDDKVAIGYGVAIGDVDGDEKQDILLADKRQFVWYRNPDWKRFVIAENLTKRDNVCIAARDIDGDGKVEIAVGAEWNPGDTTNSGSVHYLVPPEDRTQPWKPIKLQNEPVVHRMRWLRTGEDAHVLVVSPLHGRGNKGGQGAGVRLLAYHVPEDVETPWKTSLLDDTMHVTHNFDTAQWDPGSLSEEVLYIGQEGAMMISYEDGEWKKRKFSEVKSGGEIRMGLLSPASPYLLTVEPWHGTHLALYQGKFKRGSAESEPNAIGERIVLDDNMNQGHAIACGDLFGHGSQQVVAGWRGRNRDGKVGVKLYYPTDSAGNKWTSKWIDENGMACEDLRLADLNGDGRLDIVAAGRATHNLKIYWNEDRQN